MVRCCMLVLIASCCWNAAQAGDDQLMPFCSKLTEDVSDEQWKQIEQLVTVVKANIEDQAGELPYEKPAAMAQPTLLTKLRNAARGKHALWNGARFSSRLSLKTDSYIHSSAAVLNDNLSRKPGDRGRYSSSTQYNPSIEWDGYIKNSVVIINGSIDLGGHINDSIVIALGPIRIPSAYISNSLVVSCYEGDETAVDVSDGYVSKSIVVAKTCKPGSARECLIFGKTDTDDIRGARLMSWERVAAVVRNLGGDKVTLPKLQRPVKPAGPNSETLLQKLLATEELTLCNQIANLLAEFRLNAEQAKRLISAAERETSDAKRNVLWHAIRQSRDLAGREFLKDAIVKRASVAEQIIFLQTLKNPAPFDVPLLAELYQTYRPKFDPQNNRQQLTDLGDQFMRFAVRPERQLIDTDRVPEHLGYLDPSSWRAIQERRGNEAYAAQRELLRWLVRNGVRDQHRLDAWAAVISPQWPRSRGFTDWRKINHDLLQSSQDPNFRAKAVSLMANHREPASFLNEEEPVVVRMAAVRALTHKLSSTWRGYSTGRTTLLRQYTSTLEDVVESDKDESVRAAAAAALRKLRQWEARKQSRGK